MSKLALLIVSVLATSACSLPVERWLRNDLVHTDHVHRNLITLNLFRHLLDGQMIELIETKMMLQLATHLWSPRHSSHQLTPGQLALYVQALKASCVDPTNFYGEDIVAKLEKMAKNATSSFEKHLVHFTLCLNAELPEHLKGNCATIASLSPLTLHY